jgi:hypothetical protein
MANPSEMRSTLDVVASVICDAADEIEALPPGYVPLQEPPPKIEEQKASFIHARNITEVLRDPAVGDWIKKASDGIPGGLGNLFFQSTSIMAQILEMFGAVERARLPMGVFPTDLMNRRVMNLLSTWGQLGREVEKSEAGGDDDPMGMRNAIMQEILRDQMSGRVPFGRTLTTLLGPDALLWLTSDSQSGHRKLQAHEFMRTNWRNLWWIETQVEIEKELLSAPREAGYLAKSIVALSWTAVALASCFPPQLFLGEALPHLSSEREGQYTVSVGLGTHTIVEFNISAWPAMLRILAAGLLEPLLNAADMMWIGAALARVRTVASGLGVAANVAEEQFALFLSHRGRDSKLQLSAEVRKLPSNHGVFLDCLTLPHGVINRWFIYGALARTETTVVVETPNYDESDWCRKELWFADALAKHRLTRLERLSVMNALQSVHQSGEQSSRRPGDLGLRYPILSRILKDIDYWARKPNLHSLKESGYTGGELDSIQELLQADERPDEPDWVASLGSIVATTLANVVRTSPDASVFDLWAAALQLSVGAFACTSTGRSKMAVRAGVDQLNTMLRSFVEEKLHLDPVFHAAPEGHLALLAAACAVDLAGFRLDVRFTSAVIAALQGCAGFTDGVLLLDVREGGITRDYRIRLAALMVRHNFGSVGIVQDASDPVHNTRSGDLPLEVLPCVTLYPGMDAFQSPPLSTPSAAAGVRATESSILSESKRIILPPAGPPVQTPPTTPSQSGNSNDRSWPSPTRQRSRYMAVGFLAVIAIVVVYFLIWR